MKNWKSLFLGILIIVIYIGAITGLVILFDLAKRDAAIAKWLVFSFASIGVSIGVWGLWKITHLWKTDKSRLRDYMVMAFLLVLIPATLLVYEYISTIILETLYDLVRFQLSDFWWNCLNGFVVVTVLVLTVYLGMYIFYFVSKTLLPKDHKWRE